MIMIKEDYSPSADSYNVFVYRKIDIANLVYNKDDRVMRVNLKNGQYVLAKNISEDGLEHFMKMLMM